MSNIIETLEAALIAATTPEQKIDLLNALAWELRDLDHTRGQESAQTAYQLAQAHHYTKGLADSLIAQSQFTYTDFALALSNALQALPTYEQLHDLTGQSRTFYTLCWAHWFADHFVEAVEFGRRAQQLAQQTGNHALEADILNNLGLAYKRSGNYPLAYQVYNEALALYRTLGDQFRIGKVLTNIALAYASQEEYDLALAYVNECLGMNLTSPLLNGYTFLALGQAHAGKHQFDEALPHLQQALSLANAHALAQLSQAALYAMGQIYLKRQQPDLAIAHLQTALSQAQNIESNLSRYRCHETLSHIYEMQGDFVQALAHYKQFHTLQETLFNDKNVSRLQFLQIIHQAEITRREIEIYQLRNVELEQEIIERKRLQDELLQQARTDVLTGVANRRYFLELAQTAIAPMRCKNRPLAVALIDLDNFKHINDHYGHAVGDQVLIMFAKTSLSQIRESDIFARFGGDEFVVLLPNTTCEGAKRIVSRIRHLLKTQGTDLPPVTLSAGITTWHDQDTLENFLGRADDFLYQAKETGKNRILAECP